MEPLKLHFRRPVNQAPLNEDGRKVPELVGPRRKPTVRVDASEVGVGKAVAGMTIIIHTDHVSLRPVALDYGMCGAGLRRGPRHDHVGAFLG